MMVRDFSGEKNQGTNRSGVGANIDQEFVKKHEIARL